MASDREAIARRLREARENRGISQQAAADHVGLSRTLVAQIELGNRPVSEDELSKFAQLYRLPVVDFVGADITGEDDMSLSLFDVAPELLARPIKARLHRLLALCTEATSLERILGRRPRTAPAHYELPPPRTATEAIDQGEQIAEEERIRLGLGAGSIAGIRETISCQGVRAIATALPDSVSGVLLRHESIGTAVLVNSQHARARQRFSFAHEYAHGLLDRDRTVIVTKRGNAGELIEKRANAFAAAFLLPSAGVQAVLQSIDKGQPSRRTQTVYNVATEEPIRAEVRSVAASQALTYQDVAAIARRYGTSYVMTVYRLLTLGVVSDVESNDLLSAQRLGTVKRYLELFNGLEAAPPTYVQAPEDRELLAEIVELAIEAYRRQLLQKKDVAAIAERLRVAYLPPALLVEFVEAAR